MFENNSLQSVNVNISCKKRIKWRQALPFVLASAIAFKLELTSWQGRRYPFYKRSRKSVYLPERPLFKFASLAEACLAVNCHGAVCGLSTVESRTEQSEAGQYGAEQIRTKQSGTGRSRANQGKAEWGKAKRFKAALRVQLRRFLPFLSDKILIN